MVPLVWYKSCNWSWVSRARKEIQYYQNKKVCVDICSWWLKIVCQHSVTYQIVTGHLHTSMVIFIIGNPCDSLWFSLSWFEEAFGLITIVCYNRPSLSSDLNHILLSFFLFDEDSKNISTYVFSFFKVITMQYRYMATRKERDLLTFSKDLMIHVPVL